MSRKGNIAKSAWTKRDSKKAKPADELPAGILAAFPKTRSPQEAPKKVPSRCG